MNAARGVCYQKPIVVRPASALGFCTMTKLSIGTVSLILGAAFSACLVFGQTSAEQPRAIPRQPLLSNCANSDLPALGYCTSSLTPTPKLAFRNSWARVDRKKPQETLPTFDKGEPYSTVRERLLKLKWNPARTDSHDECVTGDRRCECWPEEMQECSGTGEANCIFRWRKANVVIDVNTITDDPIVTAISKCRVDCRQRMHILNTTLTKPTADCRSPAK
jgi:hypothetical protein